VLVFWTGSIQKGFQILYWMVHVVPIVRDQIPCQAVARLWDIGWSSWWIENIVLTTHLGKATIGTKYN